MNPFGVAQLIFCLLILHQILCEPNITQLPEQVHIAIGEKPSSISITWVTQAPVSTPQVHYTSHEGYPVRNGTTTNFTDGGEEKRKIYIHRVILEDLVEERVYFYKCGSVDGWSEWFRFRSLPQHANWSARLAIFGDMGVVNAQALPELAKEVSGDKFDALLHVGDFAYNMDSDGARLGDAFMRQVQPIASKVPYMTCPGNHEAAYNFSNYKARFTMPGGDGESQFYSFNIGRAHIIAFSSEFYYYLWLGWDQLVRQYAWLIHDLKEANKPENRKERPWIIAMGHRPMYCSNNDDPEHCDTIENFVRTGFSYVDPTKTGYILGLEELFYNQGVDIIIGAHEHSYERFWPVYNRTVCQPGSEDPYNNPQSPVHIVTGSAGCSEGEDPFYPSGKPWSAFRSDDYGFTRMVIHNSTHLYIEQVSVEQVPHPNVIDSVMIVKNVHGPGTYNCHEKMRTNHTAWPSLLGI